MADRNFIGTVDGDVGNPANYLEGYLPVNGDDLYFETPGVAMDTNLEILAAVQLASLNIAAKAGQVGNDDLNADYFKIGAEIVRIGYETGFSNPSMAQRIKVHLVDSGASCNVQVDNSAASSIDIGQEPIRLKIDAMTGDNATVNVRKGRVAIADQEPGEVSTLLALNVSYVSSPADDARVALGTGCTVVTITKTGGQVTHRGTATTIDNQAGDMKIEGSAAMTTLTCQAGEIVCDTTGTITTINGNGGTIDFTRTSTPRAVTTYHRRGSGVLRYDPAIVTIGTLNTGGGVSVKAA